MTERAQALRSLSLPTAPVDELTAVCRSVTGGEYIRAALAPRRDVLAERAAERALYPNLPLRSLMTAPKQVGLVAYLRGADGLVRRAVPRAFKRCTRCGRSHTRPGWDALPLVGRQSYEPGVLLELRNCSCGSTLSIEILDVEGHEVDESRRAA